MAGRTTWLYGIYADVTHRKKAEEPLHRLAKLVDAAEDAIIGHSLDGLIVEWNRGAERLYGYTKDEIQARPVLRLFAPDGAKGYARAVQRLRLGEHSEPYEAAQVRKGGERIVVSLRVSPVKDGSGKLDGVSIIARDSTTRDGPDLRVAAFANRAKAAEDQPLA